MLWIAGFFLIFILLLLYSEWRAHARLNEKIRPAFVWASDPLSLLDLLTPQQGHDVKSIFSFRLGRECGVNRNFLVLVLSLIWWSCPFKKKVCRFLICYGYLGYDLFIFFSCWHHYPDYFFRLLPVYLFAIFLTWRCRIMNNANSTRRPRPSKRPIDPT